MISFLKNSTVEFIEEKLKKFPLLISLKNFSTDFIETKLKKMDEKRKEMKNMLITFLPYIIENIVWETIAFPHTLQMSGN